MPRQPVRQHAVMQADQRHRPFQVVDQTDKFAGRVWLRQWEAAAYVGCKNVRAFYNWRDQHGIVPARNRILKRDLISALRERRPRRVMHANSLRNLRKGA